MNQATDRILTAHGRKRLRQRGMPDAQLHALLDLADRDVPVGGGCRALSVSGRCAGQARAEGASPALLERLQRRIVVLADDGRVVTVLHADGRRARHYRRGIAGRHRR
jgi:hypothetical protein